MLRDVFQFHMAFSLCCFWFWSIWQENHPSLVGVSSSVVIYAVWSSIFIFAENHPSLVGVWSSVIIYAVWSSIFIFAAIFSSFPGTYALILGLWGCHLFNSCVLLLCGKYFLLIENVFHLFLHPNSIVDDQREKANRLLLELNKCILI